MPNVKSTPSGRGDFSRVVFFFYQTLAWLFYFSLCSLSFLVFSALTSNKCGIMHENHTQRESSHSDFIFETMWVSSLVKSQRCNTDVTYRVTWLSVRGRYTGRYLFIGGLSCFACAVRIPDDRVTTGEAPPAFPPERAPYGLTRKRGNRQTSA